MTYSHLENNIVFVRLLINSNVDPEFPKKPISLEPIHRMSSSLKIDLSEEEYEYYYCFILYGAYEMVHKWINKENSPLFTARHLAIKEKPRKYAISEVL